MSLVRSVLQRIGVQPAEQSLFGWGGLCLLMVGAAAFALLNTAETLFLKRVGVESLPVALLASSGLLVVTTAVVGRMASEEPTRWLPRVLIALALALVPFVFVADSHAPVVLGALVLVARQILAVGLLAFWLAMGSLVPSRRAKQLFAPMAAGVTVGGILGSFGSEPVARLLGVPGLLALCAGLLAVAAVVGVRLRRVGTLQLGNLSSASAPRRGPPSSTFGELLRTNRLFRILAVILLCGGALSPVLYFEFSSVLDAATRGPDGEQQMLALYSQFRGWLNVAMLGSQLWLSPLLFRRIGLPLSMTLWPVAYVIGFGWLNVRFALGPAFGSLGAARVTEDGIADSATRVIYILFPDGIRNRAAGLLAGPVNRVGGVLGNCSVLAALALGGAAWIGWAAIPVALLWLAAALVLWRAYPGLLLQASAEHGLAGAGSDRSVLLDPATLRSLASSLIDEDPRICRAAVDLVVDGEQTVAVRLLSEAILHAPASNRPLLVETLHRMVEPLSPGRARSDEAIQALAQALRARPPLPGADRADLLRVLARLTGGEDGSDAVDHESSLLLERALGDRSTPVRLAAIAELHRRGTPPPGLPDLDRALAGALAASDALVRRAARKELRALLLSSSPDEHWVERLQLLASHLVERADRAETAEALREVARRHAAHTGHTRGVAEQAMRFAEDRDPRVRGALLSLAGHAGLVEQGPRMVSALGARDPEEAEGARDGLVAVGSTAALPLLVGLELGGPVRREAILAVLSELEVDAATLDSLRARQLESLQHTVVHRAAVADLAGIAGSLLRRRLEEGTAEGLGALLAILAALHGDSRILELERQLRRAGEGRESDLLIEAIESLLKRAETEAIVPLLEPGDWRARAELAARALDIRIPSCAVALTELLQSPDATTRKLADASSLEDLEPIGDPGRMASTMDTAVRLQEMPAFDRLSTPQLLSLAELLQEQKVVEGERIFSAGEEALGLYFIMEGAIELRRGELILERVGAGAFFGELSALDGVPRSVDAVATSDSRLLRLERDDLIPLLEQAPSLAIGLAQVLSSRVRRLEDRLEDALFPAGGDT